MKGSATTTTWPELAAILLARLGFLWLLVLVKLVTPPLIPLPVFEAKGPPAADESVADASSDSAARVPPAAALPPVIAQRISDYKFSLNSEINHIG